MTFFYLFITILIPFILCNSDAQYTECRGTYDCGLLKNITYPFWGLHNRPRQCGLQAYELRCQKNQNPIMKIEDQEFLVLDVNTRSHTMRIARLDLWDDPCTNNRVNTTLDYDRFAYVQGFRNLTLYYGCAPLNHSVLNNLTGLAPNNFTCKIKGTHKNISYYVDESLSGVRLHNCSLCLYNIRVPIVSTDVNVIPLENATTDQLRDVLKLGFEVEYRADWELCMSCIISHGTCGSNSTTDSFLCFCGDQTYEETCPNFRDRTVKRSKMVIIGVLASIATAVTMYAIFVVYQCRNRKQYAPSSIVTQKIFSDSSYSKDNMEKGSTYLGVHVFTYEELEEATNHFDSAKELGDGGFGTVYYGNVRDGRSVAVKRLYENNCQRVEQFMNEIEILAHLRHKNLVLLYGCTSPHSRELLLVYEYVPNGTLAVHLHGERAKPGALPWLTRMNIAIETASALSYLHASEIIHRDVKTTNILLDNNFCVKVADFGLSRFFPMNVTHISTSPQGTPGYVDPEYNQCYQLTSKSDVFSFGVVLIELISSMPAVDITRHQHEISLSNMAINKIQTHALHELVDPCLGFGSDSRIRKMITAVAEVAFQCLQSDKDMRPPMLDVLNKLKRIQSNDFNRDKVEEIDISANDVLLKSDPPPPSPDSLALNLISGCTTPNGSPTS